MHPDTQADTQLKGRGSHRRDRLLAKHFDSVDGLTEFRPLRAYLQTPQRAYRRLIAVVCLEGAMRRIR